MIDRKTIEDLIKMMVEHEIVELDVADGEQSVTIRRAGAFSAPQVTATPAIAAAPSPLQPAAASGGPAVEAPRHVGGEGQFIRSPMVGTFYSRPNPDAEPFVSAGGKVSDSTVVCLIEAMKVFNEIKAECRGTVAEILVNDGDAVEYGQPLFRLK